jgi:hypothetical protein
VWGVTSAVFGEGNGRKAMLMRQWTEGNANEATIKGGAMGNGFSLQVASALAFHQTQRIGAIEWF